jgi:nucleotide-binding universal stress UspA family protein
VNVLFATDGEEPSERACALLARTADPARTHVTVLSVNDFDVAMREAQLRGRYSPEAGHEAAQRAVDEAVAALAEARFLDVDGLVVAGDAATEVVHLAETRDVGLVVVGSGKEGWLDSVVLGSVSSSVLHGSPCPVLVVHRAPDGEGPVWVVVGADGSEGSNRSIAAFAGLADPGRCEVTVVTAARPLALPPGQTSEAALAQEAADEETALGQNHADAAAATLADAGFRVETEVVPGGAAAAVLDLVQRRDADLVVVGARGLGRFRAKVLGSVSDRVLRHAPATLVGR